MKAFVTGATGFIGRHLVGRLDAAGYAVHALLRRGSDASRLPAAITAHREPPALDALLATIRPDVVLHLATEYRHGHDHAAIAPMLAANVTLGTMLADAAARAGVGGFVTLGTAAQHAGPGGDAPATLYAASKQAFEVLLGAIARAAGLPTATLLVFETFGPGDTRGKILDRMIAAAMTGAPLDLSPGEQAIDLVHVDDVVGAIVLAAEGLAAGTLPAGGRFALSSGTAVTLRDLAGRIEATLGRPLPARWGALPYRAGEIMQPWRGGAALPGWHPRLSLDAFLAAARDRVA
ncbi:NAD(P)-dependent oxidoreductase [Elioraea sp.]|uniref:NAD-dependent epimerase/dehydratase family protein n=1 Tax=Elioraea sp. TaxID=2185103 RepID=UPI0025C489F9|nr:NAD(P)-dependent oxidoreductase [Elioraea sp.]